MQADGAGPATFQNIGKRAGPIFVCGLVLIAAILINQSAVHWRENLVDSQLFGYYGWCVAHGARPYLDVWDNKPPGIWWVNALGFIVCGEGIGGELLICSLALGGALAAFVAVARTAYSPALWPPAAVTAAVLLTHLRYECGANRTETFVIVFETLAVLGYVCWRNGGGWRWLLLGGFAAGVAPLFKQSGLAAGAACGLHLLWTQWRGGWTKNFGFWSLDFGLKAATEGTLQSKIQTPKSKILNSVSPWLFAGGGFLIAPLAAALVLFTQGALSDAWFAVGRFNRAYFEIHDASWWPFPGALRVYEPALVPLYGLYFVAGLGGLVAFLGAVKERWNFGFWILDFGLKEARPFSNPKSKIQIPKSSCPVGLFWLWFLLSAYLACAGPGRQGHHWMPTLPALGLLALYPLHRLMKGRNFTAALVASPLVAAALVAYFYLLLPLAEDNLRLTRQSWNTKPSWAALERRETPDYERQAAALRRLTRPDETVYVWGWCPGTYRSVYRRCPSRFATLEKCGQLGSLARFIGEGAVADIRRAPPAVFALYVGDWERMSNEPDNDFARWLGAHYEITETTAGMHLLRSRAGK